ncbi:MAG: hypothetical protein EBS08_00575 [Cytophagia bacterium]|nr:hypothetical protein [Cytophagia bacterium]
MDRHQLVANHIAACAVGGIVHRIIRIGYCNGLIGDDAGSGNFLKATGPGGHIGQGLTPHQQALEGDIGRMPYQRIAWGHGHQGAVLGGNHIEAALGAARRKGRVVNPCAQRKRGALASYEEARSQCGLAFEGKGCGIEGGFDFVEDAYRLVGANAEAVRLNNVGGLILELAQTRCQIMDQDGIGRDGEGDARKIGAVGRLVHYDLCPCRSCTEMQRYRGFPQARHSIRGHEPEQGICLTES